MDIVSGIGAGIVFALVVLLIPLLLLGWSLGLWIGAHQIAKAREQAEAILAGTLAVEKAEIEEIARILGTSRNSYNKSLMAKLMERL